MALKRANAASKSAEGVDDENLNACESTDTAVVPLVKFWGCGQIGGKFTLGGGGGGCGEFSITYRSTVDDAFFCRQSVCVYQRAHTQNILYTQHAFALDDHWRTTDLFQDAVWEVEASAAWSGKTLCLALLDRGSCAVPGNIVVLVAAVGLTEVPPVLSLIREHVPNKLCVRKPTQIFMRDGVVFPRW